jgi:4-amino-4-deoxy-L-arabinose transferase-like glycosyltransferase
MLVELPTDQSVRNGRHGRSPARDPVLTVNGPDGRHEEERVARWLEGQKSWNTVLVLAVVLLSVVIRFWNFGSLGYQHWDEYYFISGAESVSRSWPKGLGSISWAITPLVPYTAGTLFHFFGVNSWMPLAVSATYGSLSALALYVLGSRLFGRAVGLIAAAVLATAEFSVMFSRMALADATFAFWIIASVVSIWLGFTRRRIVYWVLAGLTTGLLLNTKYTGAFPLILAVTWVVVDFIVELVARRQRSISKTWSEYRPHVLGVAAMFAVAILLFAPWGLKLAHDPGFSVFFAHERAFSTQKTTAEFVVWYYWLFTSPPTVLMAGAGIAVGLLRFTRADRFMLLYTAGWFAALMTFDAYPREALSLLPAVAIWAGRAVVEAWSLVRGWRPQMPRLAAGAAAACVSAIVLGQVVPLSGMLSLRTEGYADAGAIAARYQSSGITIIVCAQDSAYLYLTGDAIDLPASSPTSVVQLLKERAATVVFMTDQTREWYPDIKAFFALNRDRLVVIARVPNPLYPEVLLQPATADKLSHVEDPPEAYRYIIFWRPTAPLLYPPGWQE